MREVRQMSASWLRLVLPLPAGKEAASYMHSSILFQINVSLLSPSAHLPVQFRLIHISAGGLLKAEEAAGKPAGKEAAS